MYHVNVTAPLDYKALTVRSTTSPLRRGPEVPVMVPMVPAVPGRMARGASVMPLTGVPRPVCVGADEGIVERSICASITRIHASVGT